MRRIVVTLALAASWWVPARGQEFLDEALFKGSQASGIGLYGISVFSGYSTVAYPGGVGGAPSLGYPSLGLGPDESYGASASAGWQRKLENTNLSAFYSVSYAGLVHYSGANGFSQNLNIAASWNLGPKWSLVVSGTAADADLAQTLFQPSSTSLLTQLPASFNDLAASFSVGQFSNAQNASLLSGAPTLDATEQAILFGDRVISYGGSASVTYTPNSRLSFHFASFSGGGMQQSKLPGTPSDEMSHSIGFLGGVSMSYALSPRTNLTASVNENRTVSTFQSMWDTTATAGIGRKMSERWFLSGYAGIAFLDIPQNTPQYNQDSPQSRQVIGGASLGFKSYQHTFVVSASRSTSDALGLLVGTSTTVGGSWSWHHPGSKWNLIAGFSDEQVSNTGFASLSGWQASAGVFRPLNSHTTMSAQYAYLHSSGSYLGSNTTFGIQSVRVSLGWTPQDVQR
jgi:hypothetical protein